MSDIRWWFDQARDRLLFLPAIFTMIGAIAAVGAVLVDQFLLNSDALPLIFQTSVEGGRAVLATIAGALITAYALVLSLLLVAVQLTSSQFSPRTLRNWLGDRTLQRAIGLVLGTVVFCLMVLYQTRSLGQDYAFEPNFSVLIGILLGLASLVVVLRAVDHLADSMRVGSVAQLVMKETVALVRRDDDAEPVDRPSVNPSPQPANGHVPQPPESAHVVEAKAAAWVQRIDIDVLLDVCPDGGEVTVPLAVGAFTLTSSPLAWVEPPPDDVEEFDKRVRDAIHLGDTRTMNQDIGFGILRLVDIALRALSPSLNDANTAKDVIAHLGEVVVSILEREEHDGSFERDRRRVASVGYSHREYMHAAFDQIRGSVIPLPQVTATLVRTLISVRSEIERRGLPASTSVVDELLLEIADDVRASDLSERDRGRVLQLIPSDLHGFAPAMATPIGTDGR